MGAFCCCFGCFNNPDPDDEEVDENSALQGNNSISSSNPVLVAPSNPIIVSINNPSTSLVASNDQSTSLLPVQQTDVRDRQVKAITDRSRVEPEPQEVALTQVHVNPQQLQKTKISPSESKSGYPYHKLDPNTKIMPFGEECGSAYSLPSADEEDVCPTCLEEYHEENPKIMTKCSHHYHLSCIYEWMERSETCPVCGKLMLFDEI